MRCLASWFEPPVRVRSWGPVLRIDEGWGRNRFSKPVLKHSATLARCRDTRKRKCDWRQVMPVNGRLRWSVVVWTAFRLESFVWAESNLSASSGHFVWYQRLGRLRRGGSIFDKLPPLVLRQFLCRRTLALRCVCWAENHLAKAIPTRACCHPSSEVLPLPMTDKPTQSREPDLRHVLLPFTPAPAWTCRKR
jgi:hypothetical protein